MKGPVILLEGVSKFYGQVMGLNDFSARFGEGMTGLLGPNGAGKSTMIKMITGQIRPSKGKIEVFEERPWNNPSLNLRIGYCPEQDAFFRSMSGLDFVSLAARLNGASSSEADRSARKTIALVDMTDAMGRDVNGYSKGMRQRIKLAQALVHEPELLILDEPLSGTDPLGRVKIMDLLSDLIRERRNIVISSHILHEVERMTERIVLVNKGRLVASGNIHEIRDSLDRYPLTVRIRTPQRSDLARLLTSMDCVSDISFSKDASELLVKTPDPNRFHSLFQDLVLDNRIKVVSIDSPDDNLNAIFEYLVD